jgi:hypothetical protein
MQIAIMLGEKDYSENNEKTADGQMSGGRVNIIEVLERIQDSTSNPPKETLLI